jgi:hypothetical protein
MSIETSVLSKVLRMDKMRIFSSQDDDISSFMSSRTWTGEATFISICNG